jgi:hypothetical protein
MCSEQGDAVDKKTSQRFHIPSKRTDAEKHCHLRFGNPKLILEQMTDR